MPLTVIPTQEGSLVPRDDTAPPTTLISLSFDGRRRPPTFVLVQETITLKAVLDWMDTGAPFSIAFVTSDDKRDTGGEWIEVTEAVKNDYVTREERERLDKAQPHNWLKKDPKHYENSTRNIALKNGDIRKVHIRLIRRFNGKIVM